MKSLLASKRVLPRLVFSLSTGLTFSLLIYLSYFQRNFFSWSFLAYSLIAFLTTILTIFLLFPAAQVPYLDSSQSAKRFVILSSVILSLLLLFNFPLQPFHSISPLIRLTINGIEVSDSGIGSIEFLYLHDALGYIPYKDLVISGDF
jgi:hypothetical protein